MISIDPNPTFQCLVQLTVPGQENLASINVTFAYKDLDEQKVFFEKNSASSPFDAISQILLDWKAEDVLDKEKRPVPFSPDELGKLLKRYPPSTTEILNAWQKALHESRVKN